MVLERDDSFRRFEQLSVEFTTKAQQLFMTSYENFRSSTTKLDRLRDENVFQMQLGKYLNSLRSQLENIAQELLNKYKLIKDPVECNKFLREKIDIYLREFQQKAKLL